MSFLKECEPYVIENYGYVRLPEIVITSAQKQDLGLEDTATNREFITALARRGFGKYGKKIDKKKYKTYGDRVKYELDLLDELGFIDYILLVWMVIHKARELNVFIDYGRGSVAGSCVCWLLGISGVDPIKYGLFFERFVSRARAGIKLVDGVVYLKGDLLADIDVNLGDGRSAIVEWLKTVYPGKVANILNLSTFTTKILLKDVYKNLEEADEREARRIADMVEVKFGIAQTIDEAYAANPDFKLWCDDHKEVVAISKGLSGLVRQASTHASGYLVSNVALYDLIPLELTKDGEWVSGFDMRDAANFVTKLDLLSLTTNAVIKRVLEAIPETIDEINEKLEDDPFIYNILQDRYARYGIYQISADTGYNVTRKIKPKNVFELSDVNAIARPGALAYLDGYVENNHPCAHPAFEPVLKESRNYCLYQEQMMKLAVVIGFTLDEAEMLRKIVGKKLVDKVKEWKEKIYNKAEQNGFEKEIGDILWKILEDSAKYSFNKSHSLSTSFLTALTVYLKYKYPVQFFWSCLISAKDLASAHDEITEIQKELRDFNIKLLPPDISKNYPDFTIDGANIRFGLSSIRGLKDKNLDKVILLRKENANKLELFEALQTANIPINVATALILSGCLNQLNITRSRLLLEYEFYTLLTGKNETNLVHTVAPHYNFDVLETVSQMVKNLKDEKGKPLMKESRLETIKKKYSIYKEKYQRNSQFEKLACYIYENEYLGFAYSESLKQIYSSKINDLESTSDLRKLPDNSKGRVAVLIVDEVERRISKKGSPYLRINGKDDMGSITIMMFMEERIEAMNKNNGGPLDEGDIIVCHVDKKSGDTYWSNNIVRQENPILLKKSQVEKIQEKEEKKNKKDQLENAVDAAV